MECEEPDETWKRLPWLCRGCRVLWKSNEGVDEVSGAHPAGQVASDAVALGAADRRIAVTISNIVGSALAIAA